MCVQEVGAGGGQKRVLEPLDPGAGNGTLISEEQQALLTVEPPLQPPLSLLPFFFLSFSLSFETESYYVAHAGLEITSPGWSQSFGDPPQELGSEVRTMPDLDVKG